MSIIKNLKVLILFINIVVFTSACTGKPEAVHYLTPIVTGQIFDRETQQPLSNVSIVYSSNDHTKTDTNGVFLLPPIKIEGNSFQDVEGVAETAIYIYKDGFIPKTYNNFGLARLSVNGSSEVPKYIHLGFIYLEHLPQGVSVENSYDYNEYIEQTPFCKPNDLQIEVNCIPLPDGVKNEDL